ncbi:MAG: response regulator transcription factor [Deltaproteobacteria bacterium]|nr:MAG: response regulator transcription factor [Deltaproteobacteria bacterium]
MTPIRVLICDDHMMVRRGLRSFLELHEELELVGEATNGHEALEQIDSLSPDVVLLDLVMPQLSGIEVLEQLKKRPSSPKVLVLSSFLDDEKVFAAIEVGADGYMLKDITPQELFKAIQDVHRGESPLHPRISQKLMKRLTSPSPAPSSAPEHDPRDLLTNRELDVLRLVAQGQKNKEIATHLNISPKTVKTHVSNILYKLSLKDRVQLAVWTHENNLMT